LAEHATRLARGNAGWAAPRETRRAGSAAILVLGPSGAPLKPVGHAVAIAISVVSAGTSTVASSLTVCATFRLGPVPVASVWRLRESGRWKRRECSDTGEHDYLTHDELLLPPIGRLFKTNSRDLAFRFWT
jgi:hypothetical protein